MSLTSELCVASLLVCSLAAFVVASGESSKDCDHDKLIDLLIDAIKTLETRVDELKEADKALKHELAKLKRAEKELEAADKEHEASVDELETAISGYTAGPSYDIGGSGSNFLCLPDEPDWKNYIDGTPPSGSASAKIGGGRYRFYNSGPHYNNIFSERNNDGHPLLDISASCAVCYVGGQSAVLMIPAKSQCPNGWTTEYSGYLVADKSEEGRPRSSYMCLDEAPEAAVGNKEGPVVLFPVEVECNTLPCSVYITGRELPCIVCSK